MDNVRYIHYGADEYIPNFYGGIIKNVTGFNKPIGGLWASRVDAVYGWKDYCKNEKYDMCDLSKSFEFTLKPKSNVVYLYDVNDLLNELPIASIEDIPFIDSNIKSYCIDFEVCKNSGIDAIEVMNAFAFHNALAGWDCDCILILNQDIILPV